MNNVLGNVGALVAVLLLSYPVVASVGMDGEAKVDAALNIAATEISTSQLPRADGWDLLPMDYVATLPENFGEVLLVESPRNTHRFDVQFQCATQSEYTAWIKPVPVDQVPAYKDVFADLVAEPESFSSLDEARLEASRRLPRSAPHESGYLLFERPGGRIGISDQLSGTAHSLDPIQLASLGGQTVTLEGAHGLDGNYPVLEIVHTHPPHSTHMHSGGQGEGDVYVAESLGVNVSVVHGNRIHLYQPEGKNIARHLHQVRGELVAMLDNHQH